MKKMCTYITFFLFVGNVSFSSQHSSGSESFFNNSFSLFEGTILVANDSESYQYLAESIRMHPDQETLKAMMVEAGFEQATYQNLTGGIVALHRGFKY